VKKFLIALPVILCLMISCIPFVASAEFDTVDDCILPFSYFTDEPLKQYYFHAAYSYNNDSDPPDTQVDTIFFHTDQVPDVTKNDSVVTFTFDDEVIYFESTCRVENGVRGNYSGSFNTLVVDTANQIFTLGNRSFPSAAQYKYNIECVKFDSSLDLSEPLPNVYVEFNPDLSGTVSRDVSINGNSGKLSSISMYIENRSNFNIQYCLYIHKANQSNSRWDYESPDNYSRDNLSTSFDDDPVFVYFSNQQVYSYIKTDNSMPGLGYHTPSSLYTKASYFHKLNAGESETISFPLSMINLSEKVDYRVTVTAYKLDYDYVTESSFNSDYTSIDKSNFEYDKSASFVAYDSVFNFSDLSGVKYNPNQTSGNVLPYDGSNGLSDERKYHINYDAVTDLETGEIKIGHVDNFNSDDYWNSIGIPFQDKNNVFTESFDSALDLSSFSSLFAPVFGSVSMFFNFLPPSVSMIFIFGFTCLIVIAIIKAVKS